MRITIEINNLTRKKIKADFAEKIVRKTVKLAGADLNSLEISVVFVSEAEIRKLNRKYRKKNKSTDVLSFCLHLGYNKKEISKGENYIGGPSASLREASRAGEIILCPNLIAKNALENKIKFSCELAFVLAHGVLHVLGWRHGVEMYQLQDKVVQSL
jgi:probable rRNA maturation factor